jgi:gamma-glutamylcyclotransferase (GGCT)/AIG2-like uncharacterized protein YtfP
MLYFAYGSNMYTKRLQSRVPSARVVTPVSLPDYKLFFHKRGTDGSGKGDIKKRDDSVVYGIIYEIKAEEKVVLDRIEGSGYEDVTIQIPIENQSIEVFSYLAKENHIDQSLHPYSWYKQLVLAGAKEHSLPQEYVKEIQEVKSIKDPEEERAKLELKIIE